MLSILIDHQNFYLNLSILKENYIIFFVSNTIFQISDKKRISKLIR